MTEEEFLNLIIVSIGGDTADGMLATNLPLFWAARDSVENLNYRALLVKIDGIDLLLGNTWRQVDFKALDGASVNLSDMFDHLLSLRGVAQDQADRVDAGANASGAIGELLTQAPIAPPFPFGPDANSPSYRGSPYQSRKRRGAL